MPWTLWIVAALVCLALDTLIRYVRLRDDPKAWTPFSAVIGALLWSVAWIVLASTVPHSTTIAILQAALFAVLYVAVILVLGRRFFMSR